MKKKPPKKERQWPESWKVPDGAAAVLWYEDGSITAQIPKQSAYAPESAAIMAMLACIVTSEKMRPWRKRFLAKQFAAVSK